MRYDNIMPSIIRRAFTVWLRAQNDDTEVLFRFQDASDKMPLYMLTWYTNEQEPESPWDRYEEIMVTCLSAGADGPYQSSAMKLKAMDFFQREAFIRDINRFIEYIISTGDEVSYRIKSAVIYDDTEGAEISDDGMQMKSIFYIRYCVTFEQEDLSNLYSLTNQQISDLDV